MKAKRNKGALWRAFVACAILAAVVFAPVVLDRALGLLEEQWAAVQALEKLSTFTAAYADDDASFVEDGESGTALPDGFEDVGLSFASDVSLVSDGEHLIGAVISEDSETVFNELSADLIAAGWIAVESGMDGVGSFVRGEGTYTWLALACYGVGEITGVVISIW